MSMERFIVIISKIAICYFLIFEQKVNMTVNLWAKFVSFIFRLYTELVDLHAVITFEYKLQLCLLEHFLFWTSFQN